MQLKTQKQIRYSFWKTHTCHEVYAKKRGLTTTSPHNKHCKWTRTAFARYVEALRRHGLITERLATRATL